MWSYIKLDSEPPGSQNKRGNIIIFMVCIIRRGKICPLLRKGIFFSCHWNLKQILSELCRGNTELYADVCPQVQFYKKLRGVFPVKVFIEELAFNTETFSQRWFGLDAAGVQGDLAGKSRGARALVQLCREVTAWPWAVGLTSGFNLVIGKLRAVVWCLLFWYWAIFWYVHGVISKPVSWSLSIHCFSQVLKTISKVNKGGRE